MAYEFARLLPFTWRGKHYPITNIHLSLAHDLVAHKYWGVDGARVEDTGVDALRISATIPIANTIYPGQKEKWTAGKLYPTALREFIIDFSKRTTGLLQHPEFGEIACKPERMDFEFTGEKQDSTEIRASWVETLDDEVVHKLVASPIQNVQSAASDLTASGDDLRSLAPQLPEFREDIESLGRKLTAVVDQVTVLSYRAAGVVNRILYQAHRLEVSLYRAKNALTWPAIQNLQRIQAAAFFIRKTFISPGGIGLWTVPKPMTLANVAAALPVKASIGDVIKLNPSLVRGPVVVQGALVRYALAS